MGTVVPENLILRKTERMPSGLNSQGFAVSGIQNLNRKYRNFFVWMIG